MLIKYTFDNKVYQFTREDERVDGQNVFTILVGKNGTGKSRLLSGIVNETLGGSSSVRSFDKRTITQYSGIVSEKLSYNQRPEKVVAISTSPFDKFPIPQRNSRIAGYSYLGLRDLPSENFGLAYLSKIAFELLSSVKNNLEQMNEIGGILNYLNYKNQIVLRFEGAMPKRFFDSLTKLDDVENGFKEAFDGAMLSPFRLNRRFFLDQNNKINREKLLKLREILLAHDFMFLRRKTEILLNHNGLNIGLEYFEPNDFLFLFQAGFLILKGVDLTQGVGDKVFSISDASSGEQCVVLSLLGIASQITNNALICIDEPEICLHPEWQERYMGILISTFKNYRNCHFIIATHSPQIISNLASSNCYILSIENRKIINADSVNHNSIDFQLASVFKAPGFKNEYLSRIALQTFARVSRNKRFESDDLMHLEVLENISQYLKDNDPIGLVISSLVKLRKLYA